MSSHDSFEATTLEKLKRLRQEVNWDNEERRVYFLNKFAILVNNWRGRLLEFGKTFRREEVDWILTHYTKLSGPEWYEGKAIIDLVIETGYADDPEYVIGHEEPQLRRPTALHQTLKKKWRGPPELVRDLFRIYNRFDVNYHDDEGLTHFNVACGHGLHDIVKNFLEHGQDPNYRAPSRCEPALHTALKKGQKSIVDLLLRNGADPNLADAEGSMSLHIIAKSRSDNDEFVKMLLELSDEKYHPLHINGQDTLGNTPLHSALKNKNRMLVEFLLKNGADPNSPNKKGMTPLHIACKNDCEDDFQEMVPRDLLGWKPVSMRDARCVRIIMKWVRDEDREVKRDESQLLHVICNEDRDNVDLAKMLFEQSNKKYHPVQVNAQDNKGNTPLHAALAHGCKNMFELLLRNGADPNLTNAIQVTPLHVCLGNNDLLKIFLEINDELKQTVQVDALDKEGRTPLQWAVTSLKPDTIDVLLNHGALLSKFAFHYESDFYKYVKLTDMSVQRTIESKLKVTLGILGVIESLEKGGHELDLSDALWIMVFFSGHGLFETKVKFDESWLEDEHFASESKKMMIIPSMSFYDFVRLSPKKADKRLTCTDYFRFLQKHYNQNKRRKSFLPEGSIIQTCAVYLCEQLVRRFFRSWALDCFMELTHNRLPILCCEMVIDNLLNKDLRLICSAAKR